jgi:hypothetical protein
MSLKNNVKFIFVNLIGERYIIQPHGFYAPNHPLIIKVSLYAQYQPCEESVSYIKGNIYLSAFFLQLLNESLARGFSEKISE